MEVYWELSRTPLTNLFLIPSKRQSPGMAVARPLHLKSSVTRAGYYHTYFTCSFKRAGLDTITKISWRVAKFATSRCLRRYCNAVVAKKEEATPRSSDLRQAFTNAWLPFCSHICCKYEALQDEVKSWTLWLTRLADTGLLWAVLREKHKE